MAGTKYSESYRMIMEAVRKKTAEIPLLNTETEDMLKREKHQACFFTGHRDIVGVDDEDTERLQETVRGWLDRQVESMVYQGFSTFLCGGARGFDLLAAASVLYA